MRDSCLSTIVFLLHCWALEAFAFLGASIWVSLLLFSKLLGFPTLNLKNQYSLFWCCFVFNLGLSAHFYSKACFLIRSRHFGSSSNLFERFRHFSWPFPSNIFQRWFFFFSTCDISWFNTRFRFLGNFWLLNLAPRIAQSTMNATWTSTPTLSRCILTPLRRTELSYLYKTCPDFQFRIFKEF